jgi:hypothetical protein
VEGAAADGNIGFTARSIYSGTINLVDSGAANYIETLFPRANVVDGSAGALATQHVFPAACVGATASTAATIFDFASGSSLDVEGYSNARTPVIVGDVADGSSRGASLFTIYTQSDGAAANREIKIAIENINSTDRVFDVVVRQYADDNTSPVILERFPKCSLDKTSLTYLPKMIGDSMDEEVSEYTLISKYIYVVMEDNELNQLAGYLPYGFNDIAAPFSGETFGFPEFAMTDAYVSTTSMARQWLGLDYASTDPDLIMYGHSSEWNLDAASDKRIKGFHLSSGASSTYYTPGPSGTSEYTKATAKFLVPVVGGSDGWPHSQVSRDLLGAAPTVSQATQWKAALDLISNPEEYDINILAVPGVAIDNTIGSYAIEIAETRADCLYVGDMPSTSTSAALAATVTAKIDSNYACTYWPYVKIYDADNTIDVTIPPTPQALEALAYTDSVSYPWFAPAGLNRGLLTDVIRAKYKLTQENRETLYDAKINPIVTFPGQGISIWGQKTLQTRTTALDRINVRRMLLYVEKVIAGASKYLVFEQNDEATWDRFKAMVQPILDTVRIKRGIVEFRVIMDETTNTPEMIDRNQMVGQIYIKPTKTAEVILINFNILPQGATFEE